MTTYSTSLKLTLIGDGEQTGTWGSTTNANFGTLLEQAIVGQTTIIMANADYTLTNLNGTTDEARSAVIIVTGTQNASYSVIVPAVPKLYMVTNSLTSPQVAYIKMSGGTTTQVPNGQTMYLYCTGVVGSSWGALNYVQNAQNLITGGTITTGAINCTSLTSSGAIVGTTIGGTTITASTQFSGPGTGLTGTASSLISGNVNGVVAVVNGGSGVTTSTGTGNNVLSTSPTLVTPILGTPTSGNLANCTGYPAGSITGTVNLATQVTGTLAVANGGTGVTSSTGTSSVVLSASPTLTGTPLAPTAASSTSTTQIATTAFVQAVKQTLYPIGSIYSSTAATNPGDASMLGFGTWTAFGEGRVMIGAGGIWTAGSVGGSVDAVLVSHTHTGTTGSTSVDHTHTATSVVADPGHLHSYNYSNGPLAGGGTGSLVQVGSENTNTSTTGITVATTNGGQSVTHTHDFTTNSAGSSGTNANLQPYVIVYMWNRTA